MQIKNFENLSSQEIAQLANALPLIGILIAGADGTIDDEEAHWAERLTQMRSFSNKRELQAFYDYAEKDYWDKFQAHLKSLPDDPEARSTIISAELSKINDILPKLEPKIGKLMYNSLTSFAKSVAKASGGIFGIGSISENERRWVDLPMISKID